MEPSAKPGAADFVARELELEPGQPLEQRRAGARTSVGVYQVRRAAVLPVGPVPLGERLEHEADEPRLVAQRHWERKKTS